MIDCPRCGSAAEALVPLPAEVLEEPVLEGGGTAGRASEETFGKVCEWCRHEVIEG